MPDNARPQKITFAEMRNMGVRGILVYCADYIARIRSRSAATDGLMTSGCQIILPTQAPAETT
jgi:hypothetical protein